MKQTVNYFDYEHDGFANWLIIHAITEMEIDIASLDAKNLEIVFTINGVDVPFVGMLHELERQHEQMVAEHAKQFLKNKLAAVEDKLRQVALYIDERFEEMLTEDTP